MKYTLLKIFCMIMHKDFNKETIKFLLKKGIKIGNNCHIYSNIATTESYLIEIKDDVTISTDVTFLTHDNSISKVDRSMTDLFGKITIGNNCFIGSNVLILPGIKIEDNIIVGAGSIICKSLTEKNSVYAGNPARRICSIEEYYNKNKEYGINIDGMDQNQKKELITSSKLLER